MKNVGPYMYVTHDHVRDDGYRLLISGAYNAMGLIGPEYNGIVVLDEVEEQLIADNIGRQNSGWYQTNSGPGKNLVALFEELVAASPEDFADRVNELGGSRLRMKISARTLETASPGM